MNPFLYPKKRVQSVLLALLPPLLGLLSVGQAVYAQQPTISSLTVDSADLSNISISATFEDLSKDVGVDDFVILEDGNVQQVTERNGTGPGGAQVALLIDIVQYPGVEPILEQAKNAILTTGDDPPFQGAISTRDSFAAFAPGADGTSLATIMGWMPDYVAMVNNIYNNFQPAASASTALKDLTLQALEQFDAANPNVKALIVFSDGIDIKSTTSEEAIKNKAQEMGVQIHTVLLGGVEGQDSATMQALATVSGGESINLASQPVDTLAPYLAARKGEVMLRYSSQQVAPKTLQLQVTNNGETVSSPISELGIPAPEPLQLAILLPIEGESKELPETTDAVAAESECVFQQMSLEILEPDGSGLTRQLQQVEVRLRGPTIPYPSKTLTEPPWTEAKICLENMAAGTYLVEAELVDEFGLASEAEEVLLFLTPPPEPPPPPLTLWARLQNNVVVFLTSLVALAALGVALFALRRQPYVKNPTEFLTGKVTEVFGGRRPSPAKSSAPAKAKLTLVSNPMKNVPNVILINRENTKIGRDRTVVDEVVKNQFISRLHCRIEETNGRFYLIDEGAASGTYVNEAEDAIPINGQPLNHGDTIHLGPIQYYFELFTPELESDTEYYSEPEDGNKTQPYMRRPSPHASTSDVATQRTEAQIHENLTAGESAESWSDPEETEPYGMANRSGPVEESAKSTQSTAPEETDQNSEVPAGGSGQITEKYDEMVHGRAEDVEAPVDTDKTEPYADKEG